MSRFGGEEGDLNHGLQGDWQGKVKSPAFCMAAELRESAA